MFWRQKDFPKELLIGDHWWTIKFVRKIPEEQDTTLGLCDPSEKMIYIKQGQTSIERLTTLYHEIGHAYEEEYGKEIPHEIIEWFAVAHAKLLTDNAA